MSIKNYFILLFISLSSLKHYSQTVKVLKYDLGKCTIEFTNGKSLDAYVLRFDVIGALGKDKIKVYKDKANKIHEKIPISDIDKMILYPSESELDAYKKYLDTNPDLTYNKDVLEFNLKVLYSPKRRIPRICQEVFIGDNIEFYRYDAVNPEGGPVRQIFITKPKDNTFIHHFLNSNRKTKNLKQLSMYFKDCEAFEKVANEKKAHKIYKMEYFYKLIDENCN